jgi:hypothetical protein
MIPHSYLLDKHQNYLRRVLQDVPTDDQTDGMGTNSDPRFSDNPNQHLSTDGMIMTLAINLVIFWIIQAVFETNRYYKQIYLKRLQKRFQVIWTSSVMVLEVSATFFSYF